MQTMQNHSEPNSSTLGNEPSQESASRIRKVRSKKNPSDKPNEVSPARDKAPQPEAVALAHPWKTEAKTVHRTDPENLRVAGHNLGAISPKPPLTIAMLEPLRIDQPGMSDSVPVPSVPKICKPGKQTFFRVLGDESDWHTYNFFVPEGDMGQSVYLVAPDVAAALGAVVSQKRLVPCITLDGDIFFWPMAVSDRPNSWSDSARVIAGEAQTEWRRMVPDNKAKEYRAWKPRIPKPDPVWPDDVEMYSLLLKALEGKIIESIDHPEVLKLL